MLIGSAQYTYFCSKIENRPISCQVFYSSRKYERNVELCLSTGRPDYGPPQTQTFTIITLKYIHYFLTFYYKHTQHTLHSFPIFRVGSGNKQSASILREQHWRMGLSSQHGAASLLSSKLSAAQGQGCTANSREENAGHHC